MNLCSKHLILLFMKICLSIYIIFDTFDLFFVCFLGMLINIRLIMIWIKGKKPIYFLIVIKKIYRHMWLNHALDFIYIFSDFKDIVNIKTWTFSQI